MAECGSTTAPCVRAHWEPAAPALAEAGAGPATRRRTICRREPLPPAPRRPRRAHPRHRRRPCPRRARGGRRAGGLGLRLLAGRRRLGRGRGREEALPPGEDLWRRPHAAVGAPARPTWASGTPSPGPTATRVCGPVPTARQIEMPWPDHPSFPSLRLRDHPPRPRPDGGRAGRQGGGGGVGGGRGRRAPSSTGPPPARSAAAGSGHRGAPRPAPERGCSTVRRARPGRSAPATWWWPTVPTPASAGPSARPGTGPIPSAWRSAATSAPRATTRRSSSPTSTSGTTRATSCPATAGSSPSATGG